MGTRKISKAVYEVNTTDGADIYYVVQKDPTNGIYAVGSSTGKTSVDVRLKLYDENGKVIEYEADKPAYFGLNSLNRNDDPTPSVIEKFSNTNMKFIGITGSLVSEHADGIYSNSQTL